MIFKISVFLIILLYAFSANLYAQEREYSAFEKYVKTKSDPFTKEVDFKKAQSFFLEREWDSTLLYTSKQLGLRNTDTQLKDFSHFLRGYSFKQGGFNS